MGKTIPMRQQQGQESAYRTSASPEAKLAPRAPWWRILRALLDGTLRRWKGREPVWICSDGGAGWMRRDGRRALPNRRFTDEEIDQLLPPSLRRASP